MGFRLEGVSGFRGLGFRVLSFQETGILAKEFKVWLGP